MRALKHIPFYGMFMLLTIGSKVIATEKKENDFIFSQVLHTPPNSQVNNSLPKGYVYKTPENRRHLNTNCSTENLPTAVNTNGISSVVEKFQCTNLISRFDECAGLVTPIIPNVPKKQLNINTFMSSLDFLKEQPLLEDRRLIKRGGSHLLKQTNKLDVSSDEKQFILKLNFKDDDVISNDCESGTQNNCKGSSKILTNERQHEIQKTSLMSASPKASVDNLKLDRSFSSGDLFNLTSHKKCNFQLSYAGQCQNTTFYSKSKNTNELFFNLLELMDSDICNWSINSETNF